MRQPPNNQQDSPTPGKNSIMIIGILFGIGIVVLAALVIFLFRGNIFQALAPSTETPVIPTMFIPTPDCGSPTLVLGTVIFEIQNITPAPDGSLSVPPDTSGIAYWVDATDTNYVFVLSPTPDNLSLISSLKAGDTAKATWSNCNSTTYNLFTPEQSLASVSTLFDQSTIGITIFIQSDPSTANLVVRGELTEEQFSTINTPAAGTEVQAEISLLETTTSPDGTTIRVGISIQNYGASAFTLSGSDVSLTSQDGTALIMVNSEPVLPKEIGPGATETIDLTFQRPASPTATIKILGVEYELEGY